MQDVGYSNERETQGHDTNDAPQKFSLPVVNHVFSKLHQSQTGLPYHLATTIRSKKPATAALLAAILMAQKLWESVCHMFASTNCASVRYLRCSPYPFVAATVERAPQTTRNPCENISQLHDMRLEGSKLTHAIHSITSSQPSRPATLSLEYVLTATKSKHTMISVHITATRRGPRPPYKLIVVDIMEAVDVLY